MLKTPRVLPDDYHTWSTTKKKRNHAMWKAAQDHKKLLWTLGNECAWCHRGPDECQLQVDHVDGRDRNQSNAVMNRKRWDTRVAHYWKELKAGIRLRVLCKECNSKDGRRRQMEQDDLLKELPDAPF